MEFFTNCLTNAICEGINSSVQAAKRKARGFHTIQGYITMIFLVAGKLNLETIKPFYICLINDNGSRAKIDFRGTPGEKRLKKKFTHSFPLILL